MQSRTIIFFKNSAGTAFMYFITMIAGFIVPRIMIEVYGSEINGLITSLTQFISYFNLLSVGISAAAVWALYKPLAEENYSLINAIIDSSEKKYRNAGIIFIILTLLLALLYPYFINVVALSNLEVFLLVLIIGISGIIEIFSVSKCTTLLTADQKIYVISLSSVIAVILNTLIVAILACFYVDIVIVRFVALISVLTRSFILNLYLKKYYKYLNLKKHYVDIKLDKWWDATLQQLLNIIQTGGPIILATIFTDLKTVSIFAIFNLVVNGVNSILSVCRSGVYTSFGNIIAKNESNVLKKVYNEFELSYYIMIAIVYSVAFVMIMPFIKIYTQDIADINYIIPSVGLLMLLNGLTLNLRTPQNTMVLAAGWYKETQKPNILQNVILILFGSIGGYYFGLKGIIVASIISNLYRNIDLLIFIPKYLLHISPSKTFIRVCLIYIICLVIYTISSFFSITINNFIEWFACSIIVFILTTIIVISIMFIFEKKTMLQICSRILNILRIINFN